jgi:serine/threonine protein phosphatase PrpC
MVKTQIRCAGGSDAGRVRHNNEDAWHADVDRGFFLVVDGIGGQAAGEKAAQIAVERVRARLERQTGTTEQRIREAITMANNEILNAAQANPEWKGMACVLTLVVLENGSAVAGHVGDSRLYHVRAREIRKITHDHSPVGEREDNHELSEAEAMRHPRRNEVFRDVGSEKHAPEDENFIEVQRFPFEPDSALLLCSDGLSDQVPSAVILRTVERHAGAPEETVRELIHAANRAGGKDNVTVLVVEGEQFTRPPQLREQPQLRRRRWPWIVGLLALILIGIAAAVILPNLWKQRTVTVVLTPAVRSVGPGQNYTTIPAALADAHPGDVIEVLSGEYRGQIALKTGVTVRSRIPREAVLRGAPGSDVPLVLAEGVNGARISGFKILAAPDAPLTSGVLLNNSAVEVDDLEIAGAGVGIEIRGEASPLLRANNIHDCTSDAVLVVGLSKPWLSHNSIQRNKGAAIAAQEGAAPVLLDNRIEGNAGDRAPAAGKKKK